MICKWMHMAHFKTGSGPNLVHRLKFASCCFKFLNICMVTFSSYFWHFWVCFYWLMFLLLMYHIFLLIRFRYFLLDAGHVVNTRLLVFTDLIVEFTDFVVFLCRASIFCFGGQLSYLWISLTCLRLLKRCVMACLE